MRSGQFGGQKSFNPGGYRGGVRWLPAFKQFFLPPSSSCVYNFCTISHKNSIAHVRWLSAWWTKKEVEEGEEEDFTPGCAQFLCTGLFAKKQWIKDFLNPGQAEFRETWRSKITCPRGVRVLKLCVVLDVKRNETQRMLIVNRASLSALSLHALYTKSLNKKHRKSWVTFNCEIRKNAVTHAVV